MQKNQVSNLLYDELNIKDKELIDKLKKYEIVRPQDETSIGNEFPDFYNPVGNFVR